ncbi:DNA-binding protein HU [Bacillus phage vB_BanS-Thrax3]|nr:DNA-binding protein HU [Bacillus phage vB_BanS-Thrax1]UUV46415.1 DNA-binding protein HU [Bacillus phage vB_BanS-Thrax3]
MNLSELIHKVWKDKRVKDLGIRKSEVKVVVKVAVDHMVKGLLEYGKLKLTGLFTLVVKKAKGRRIRNPQTGEITYSNDYNKINIKPSQRLKDGLKKFKK